jgi:hypothetical protein
MYEIEMNKISEAFFPCWKAAGIHLSCQIKFHSGHFTTT